MNTQLHQLGQSLRERREQLGLSQRRLAEKVGIRHTHVSRVERGESGVSLSVLAKLADVLQVPPQWLIGESKGPVPTPKMRPDELKEEEASLVRLFRQLSKSDRRFISRWLEAIVRYAEPKNQAEGGWAPIRSKESESRAPFVVEDNTSAMTVYGEELSAVGIHHGDLVATSKREPQPGDVVVALLDDVEQVIRVWQPRENGTVELLSANGEERALVVDTRRVAVQSVVTHVWRQQSAV